MSCDAPLACTLARSDHDARAAAFREVFLALERVEEIPGGFRWRFEAREGLFEALTDLAERERTCCAFMAIDVRRVASQITWEATARPEAEATMRDFMRLPELMTSVADAASLRDVLSRIEFVSHTATSSAGVVLSDHQRITT